MMTIVITAIPSSTVIIRLVPLVVSYLRFVSLLEFPNILWGMDIGVFSSRFHLSIHKRQKRSIFKYTLKCPFRRELN